MTMPSLSILVPTRERADTLRHTLQTLVSQNYDNLEIVVCDNASTDSTRDVVAGFSDPRIRYFRNEKRTGMSQNWEIGLSRVTGEYVSILGDDDGFLPNACHDVAGLISERSLQALIWQKATYEWPGIPGVPHKLSFPTGSELVEMNSRLLLWLIANAFTSYGRLPMLYTGFVSVASINAIKSRAGNFFHSNMPDVYSGLVLAGLLDSYLYSIRPFSINGGSRHSNGISNQKDATKEAANIFYTESDRGEHADIGIIQGSIASYVGESYLQAFDRNLTRGIRLNRKRYMERIYLELLANERGIRNAGLEKLATLKIGGKLAWKIHKVLAASGDVSQVTSQAVVKPPQGTARFIHVDCDLFPIGNINDACVFLGNLLGPYTAPEFVHRLSIATLLATLAGNKVQRWLPGLRLPF